MFKLVAILLVYVLIAIATNAAPSNQHQCLNQPSPDGSATSIDDLQQVTTLQYCLADNCTIKMIDSGEELDIIYTTDSLLVVTLNGNQTSMVIFKSEYEQSCTSIATGGDQVIFIGQEVAYALIALVNLYLLVLHLIYKEMRTLFGHLLIIYSVSVLVFYTSSKAMYATPFITNSLFMCEILSLIFQICRTAREATSTCILACVAQLMHRSDNFRSGMPKHSLRNYLMYILGTMTLFGVVAIGHRLITGDPIATRQGPCQQANASLLIIIAFSFVTLSKAIQMGLFGVYLFYFFKFSKEGITDHNNQHLRLSKIAIFLGAAIGIAQVVWLASSFAWIPSTNVLGLILFAVQQCVIAVLMTCSKGTVNRCKGNFCCPDTNT